MTTDTWDSPTHAPRSTRRILALILTGLITFGAITAVGLIALSEHRDATVTHTTLSHTRGDLAAVRTDRANLSGELRRSQALVDERETDLRVARDRQTACDIAVKAGSLLITSQQSLNAYLAGDDSLDTAGNIGDAQTTMTALKGVLSRGGYTDWTEAASACNSDYAGTTDTESTTT